jgi:diadenylate cyclase
VDRLAAGTDERLVEALKMIAPGTLLRQAIDNIVRARTGALIVFADEATIRPLISGGIDIDAALRPMILYELAKMDGAILLDISGKHILHANVQLMPDSSIESQETGTRHRTAERVAKQLGVLAISISAARDVVTVYVGDIRYIMDPIRTMLDKADQALQTLERFRNRLNQVAAELTELEFRERVTLIDVTTYLQRAEMTMALSQLIERYVVELGSEGRLVELQREELVYGVKEDRAAVLHDYLPDPTPERVEEVRKAIIDLPSDELISMNRIGEILGYTPEVNFLEQSVSPRGFRMLRKLPRLSDQVIGDLIDRFGTLSAVIAASVEELASVEGVDEYRARDIKEGLARLRDSDIRERYGSCT